MHRSEMKNGSIQCILKLKTNRNVNSNSETFRSSESFEMWTVKSETFRSSEPFGIWSVTLIVMKLVSELSLVYSFLTLVKFDWIGRTFVKKSINWTEDLTKWTSTFPSSTWSFMKWYVCAIWFVLECCTGFWKILIALLESQ